MGEDKSFSFCGLKNSSSFLLWVGVCVGLHATSCMMKRKASLGKVWKLFERHCIDKRMKLDGTWCRWMQITCSFSGGAEIWRHSERNKSSGLLILSKTWRVSIGTWPKLHVLSSMLVNWVYWCLLTHVKARLWHDGKLWQIPVPECTVLCELCNVMIYALFQTEIALRNSGMVYYKHVIQHSSMLARTVLAKSH